MLCFELLMVSRSSYRGVISIGIVTSYIDCDGGINFMENNTVNSMPLLENQEKSGSSLIVLGLIIVTQYFPTR